MHCGQMLAAGPRPMQPVAGPQVTGGMPAYAPTAMPLSQDVRKRNTWLAVVISAVILLMAIFGLRAAGVLHLGQKAPDTSSLQAVGSSQGSFLQNEGKGGPSVLPAAKKTMPQDLYDWLQHLAKCEKHKQAITGKQLQQARELQSELGGASGLTTAEDVQKMSDPDYNSFPTLDKATAMLNELQPDWVALKKEFDSVPPPAECKPIAEAYDSGLQNIVDMFDTVEKIVGGVNLTDQTNIRKSADDARQAGLQHRKGIDGEFETTDDLVQQICDKYETKKWFKIDAHGGSAGLMGF